MLQNERKIGSRVILSGGRSPESNPEGDRRSGSPNVERTDPLTNYPVSYTHLTLPTIGYLLGSFFESYINAFDHWVAFVLLALIGANMLKEAFSKKEAEETDASFSFRSMLVLAVATSIDALAVGITFALLPDVNIVAAVSFIGVITFILSAIGLKVGNLFGLRYKQKAEIAGGIILILIGLKILLEHLGVINF